MAQLVSPCAYSETDKLTIAIEADKPAGTVSPLLYGLMTEEINHSYDGGLYAELIQNRAFLDDPKVPAHWNLIAANGASANIQLDATQSLNSALPVSLRLDASSASDTAPAGIANEGYWGIPAYSNTRYKASFYAKAAPGFSGKITVSIQSEDGKTIFASGVVDALGQEWKQYQVSLQTGQLPTPVKARYVLSINQPGTVWFSLASLFPPTWNDRPNGLRKDLMQMLVDLKPRFVRFPGGLYLEGKTIKSRFDWKKTIGPVSERPGHDGFWNYRSSDGMGLLEFLLWCEDLGAEPVLGVYAGYSMNEPAVNPGPEMDPFVQDALEEIEYITGPATSKWGAQRAKDGHPKPFGLRYIEIGNEDFFDRSGSYDGRFAQIFDAIKKEYPKIECISSIGVYSKPVKGLLSSRTPDLIDKHYYRTTEEFVKLSTDFNKKFDRKGPKVLVGEWAAYEDARFKPWKSPAHEHPPTPSMKAAIGDAVFMTSMERNSDIVAMHCYAPLFANVNPGARQWRPNLIGYDALRSYGSPSYYALAMFSQNIGDQILNLTKAAETPVHVSATRDSKTGILFLKLVNPTGAEQAVGIELKGIQSLNPAAIETLLAAPPEETNSIEAPTKVLPKKSRLEGIKPSLNFKVPANSIVLLKIRTR